MRGVGMIEIVRVLQRMRQHEGRIFLAVDVDHAVEVLVVELERIVAAVEEFDLGAQKLRRALGFVLAAGFDLLERRAGFFPRELAFAPFAVGHAHDLHPIAALGVQRDGAARAPDEIARVRRDHKPGFLLRHKRTPPNCGGFLTG